MNSVKDALLRDVVACRDLLKIHDALEKCGPRRDPFWKNFMETADGIYKLIGEKADTFEQSVTHLVLTAPYLTNERRTEMLYAEYRKNHAEQLNQVAVA